MANKTVLAQLEDLLEKRNLKQVDAGSLVDAAEVTNKENVSPCECVCT